MLRKFYECTLYRRKEKRTIRKCHPIPLKKDLGDAIEAAEFFLRINEEPHLPKFDPDKDFLEIKISEICLDEEGLIKKVSEPKVIVSYILGTYFPNQRLTDSNLQRKAEVIKRWERDYELWKFLERNIINESYGTPNN